GVAPLAVNLQGLQPVACLQDIEAAFKQHAAERRASGRIIVHEENAPFGWFAGLAQRRRFRFGPGPLARERRFVVLVNRHSCSAFLFSIRDGCGPVTRRIRNAILVLQSFVRREAEMSKLPTTVLAVPSLVDLVAI